MNAYEALCYADIAEDVYVGTSENEEVEPGWCYATDMLAEDTGDSHTLCGRFLIVIWCVAISGNAHEVGCRVRSGSAVAAMQATKSGSMYVNGISAEVYTGYSRKGYQIQWELIRSTYNQIGLVTGSPGDTLQDILF